MAKHCFLLAIVLLASATTEARPGLVVDPQEACLGQPPGAFVNNPADCQAFWICGGDFPTNGRCPNGYNFNHATTLCELPEDFPCPDDDEANEVEVTTVIPSTSSPPSPPPTDENVCQHRPNGYFVNNPVNCQAYWVCYNSSAHEASCQPGLNFNEAAQVCDNPANYPCSNGDEETDSEFRCPASGIQMFSMPDSCTRFRFCFSGHLSIRECVVGLHFDELLQRCNFEELVECSRGMCPLVDDPHNVVTLASRVYCEDFYICYDGEPKPFSCAPGLHWNQLQRHCDFPKNVNCLIAERPPPVTIKCPDLTVEGLHIIAHPFDCARYFICSLGVPFEQVCPDDLKFDPSLGTCNKPNRFECFAESVKSGE